MKILWIALTIFIAFALGKRVLFWAIMAYMFSWFALILVVLIPANQAKVDARKKQVDGWADEQAIKAHFKSIDNVEELFNQLEKK